MSGKSQKEIAQLIHTTAKTLQNYSAGLKRLPMLQSELLLKLFALYDKGLGVFEGVESFNGWLQKPAFGLYNDVPDTLLFTSTGINLVMDELIRIEYGDIA
ncbi:MAG: antitoxin Xre/MbcA/ParS toxin-binding domain-containing protein [Segetibacter sp.]